MLLDAEQLDDGSLLESAVIIAGGGMAGLLLARELGNAGIDVIVLESGGETPESRVQSLYAGRMTLGGPGNPTRDLDDYLISSRIRCLGGSGNVWGGKCAPLDPMDFERRDWIPHSGWPVTRAGMQPFYDRACDLLGLPRFATDAETMVGGREPVFAGRSTQFTARARCYSRYTGAIADGSYDAYKQVAAQHPRVRIYLKANLARVHLASNGRRVDSLEVRCLNGRKHRARAGNYVLAMGGVENARLLMASNDVLRDGIGNHSDWLGRGFQGHATIERNERTSLMLMRGGASLAPFNLMDRSKPHIVLGASDAAQRSSKGVNFTVTVADSVAAGNGPGAMVQSLASRLAGVASGERRSIYFMLEHTPNRDSRLTLLLDERDELRMPRVRLDMRYGAIEFDRFPTTVATFAGELGRCETGRLQWNGGSDSLIAAMSLSRHHMGATRMAINAGDGVVDEHCKVHGVNNLHVAGSSVFPTSGIANPTLTLLALTFRLGDRLSSQRSAFL